MNRREEIISWISEIFQKNLNQINYRAFIFGSQANLKQLRRADIDVGIVANQPVKIEQLTKINDAIEQLPMLYNIDVVDFYQVDERFKTVAMRNIESI